MAPSPCTRRLLWRTGSARASAHLGDPVGVRAKELNSSAARERRRRRALHHRQPGRALGSCGRHLGDVGVPFAPQPGVDVDAGEAVDRLGQLALEGLAAKLAVGHDRTARRLLQGDDVPDRGVPRSP